MIKFLIKQGKSAQALMDEMKAFMAVLYNNDWGKLDFHLQI